MKFVASFGSSITQSIRSMRNHLPISTASHPSLSSCRNSMNFSSRGRALTPNTSSYSSRSSPFLVRSNDDFIPDANTCGFRCHLNGQLLYTVSTTSWLVLSLCQYCSILLHLERPPQRHLDVVTPLQQHVVLVFVVVAWETI